MYDVITMYTQRERHVFLCSLALPLCRFYSPTLMYIATSLVGATNGSYTDPVSLSHLVRAVCYQVKPWSVGALSLEHNIYSW